ncbi:unnamed protein product, partial [Schistocephalus solidus]|uniref:Uncharacterized protein n=1 Tax=Schistocephalus solidus TaxID=70667 RepID=A0A183SLQ3_SCHSO
MTEKPLNTGNGTILCDVSTSSHRPFVPPFFRRKVFSHCTTYLILGVDLLTSRFSTASSGLGFTRIKKLEQVSWHCSTAVPTSSPVWIVTLDGRKLSLCPMTLLQRFARLSSISSIPSASLHAAFGRPFPRLHFCPAVFLPASISRWIQSTGMIASEDADSPALSASRSWRRRTHALESRPATETTDSDNWSEEAASGNPRSNRPERKMTRVAWKLAQYKVDIVALSETRFSEQGQLEE